MKELSNTKRLTYATVFFILLIIVVLLSIKRPAFNYEITPAQLHEEMATNDYQLTPYEADELLRSKGDQTFLIDIREQYSTSDHLTGALHISKIDLLKKESRNLLDDKDKTFILLGENEQDATSAWMLLRQIGFENIKVLSGTYNCLANVDKDSNPENYIRPEKAVYDYSEYLAAAQVKAGEFSRKQVIVQNVPVKRSKRQVISTTTTSPSTTTSSAGQTPKKVTPKKVVPKKVTKKVVEEEEGC